MTPGDNHLIYCPAESHSVKQRKTYNNFSNNDNTHNTKYG